MLRLHFPGALCAAFLMMLAARPAHAEFPVKADIKFQCDIRFAPANGCANAYKAPWYVYFPVDPLLNQNQQMPHRFPNWPGCFPPPDAGQGCHGGAPPGCPGATSRAFPNWPAGNDWSGGRAQPAAYARMDGQPGNITPTSYSMPSVPYWQQPPAYPTNWAPYYYYGR